MHSFLRLFLGLLVFFSASTAAVAQEMVPPDQSFRTVGAWAVRVDKVTYGAGMTGFRQELRTWVMIETTVRNASSSPQMFNASLFTSQMSNGSSVYTAPNGGFTTHDQRTRGGPMGGAVGEAVAHVVPAGEVRRAYFRYQVGDHAAQRQLASWTLIENNPIVLPGQRRERGRVTITIPRLTTTTAPVVQPDRPSTQFGNDWRLSIDRVQYSAPQPMRTDVMVRVRFNNFSGRPATLSKEQVRVLLDRRSGLRMSPFDFMLTAGSNPQSADTQTAPAGGDLFAEFYFRVGDELAQRDVHLLTLIPREQYEGAWRDSTRIVQLPVQAYAPPGATAPTVPPATANPGARLKALEGRYRTNRGTFIDFKVEGTELVGQAITVSRPTPRELVKLTLHDDNSLRGTMRDEDGPGRFVWYDVTLRFTPDGARFAGEGRYTHAASNPPISYTGAREAVAANAAPPTAGSAAGFTEAGYFALRPEMARVSNDHWGAPRVEVGMTARNTQGGRRGVQYVDNTFFLVGADGAEYRSDGNFYGASADDRLNATVWVEKDEEAQMTLVFGNVPAGVRPARLIVRDSQRRQQVASLDLTQLSGTRTPTAPSENGGTATPVAPVTLQNYEVTLEKVERGADGLLESVMTLKNIGTAPQRVLINDLTVVLYGQDGQARHADGNFYMPDAATRTVMRDAGILAPGRSIRVRRVHPQSTGVTPTSLRVQEGGRSGATGVPRS